MSTESQDKSKGKETGLIHSIYRISLKKLFPNDKDTIHKSFDEIKDTFSGIIGVVGEEQTDLEKKLINKKIRDDENKGKDNNNDNLYRSYEICEDKGTSTKAAFYVKCGKADIKEFADFYSPLLSDKEALNGFLKDNEPRYLSTILLLQTRQKRLYAVASGFARYSIQSIIEKDFGLKVLGHEIEYLKISGRTLNPLEGMVQVEYEVYNQLVHINNIQTYTGVIGKISGRLTKSKMVKKLCDGDLNSVAVNAKDSIRIGGKATFANLCRFLKCIDEKVKEEATADKINSIQRIENEKIKEEIWGQIYRRLVNTETGEEAERNGEEIYIFPEKDAEVYLSANSYKLSSRGNEDGRLPSEMPLLLKDITSWDGKGDENQMKQFIENEKIQFMTEALDDVHKKIPLKSCLNGYVRGRGGNTYILRYGELYQYSKKAKEALQDKVSVYLEDIWMQRDQLDIPETFEVEVEKKENKKGSKGDNTSAEGDKNSHETVSEEAVLRKMCEGKNGNYLFHTCYAQGPRVEIADIITEKEEKYYFIHAKRGFDGSMRVLQKQIEVSIYNLMRYMRASEKEKDGFFNSLCEKQKAIWENKAEQVPEDFFKDIKIGDIEYVACLIVGTKTEGKSLREYITDSDSFSALLCLDELHEYCFKMRIKLHLFLLSNCGNKGENKWEIYSAGEFDKEK